VTLVVPQVFCAPSRLGVVRQAMGSLVQRLSVAQVGN